MKKKMSTLTINGSTYQVSDPEALSFVAEQELTENQKKRAKENIGVNTLIVTINEETGKPSHTVAEMKAHIQNGGTVLFDLYNAGDYLMQPVAFGNDYVFISHASDDTLITTYYLTDDGVEEYEYGVVTHDEYNGRYNELTDSMHDLDHRVRDTEEALEAKSKEYANALKGTASGEVVALTDVSPLEHEMKVKASQGGATVKKYGLNVFDQEAVFTTRKWVEQNDGSWLCGTFNGAVFYPPANGQMFFRVTAKAVPNAHISPFRIRIFYTDNSNEDVCTLGGTQTEWITLTGKSTASKTISRVHFTYGGSSGASGSHYLKDVIFSYANAPYEPYVEPITYTADENGDVKGVMSVYPSTTLIAEDGATVTAEYNKDTNKVIENLVQAIISLGGNV